MKAPKCLFSMIAGLIGVMPVPFLHAAILTWNGGVSGDWANGGTGWTGGNWNNANPDSAIFAGASPTNITINTGGITVDDITVSSGNYNIGGSGTLTLSNSTIDIANGLTTTINSALAGSTGLIKSGAGTLILSGTNKNYTGTTTINGGAIQISAADAGNLGSTNNGAVSLNGGALHGNFTANTNVNYAISVGASGGEIRNLGGDSSRWNLVSNTISGSGTLTLSFGSNNTRFVMSTTTQNSFNGKWVIDSGGNVNRFVDVDGSSTFGNVTGDEAVTLVNSGTILFRNTRTYGSGFGITVGSGGGNIATGGGQTVELSAKISGAAGNNLRLDLGNSTSVLVLTNTSNSWLGSTTLAGSGTLRLGASGVIADTGGTIDMGSTTSFDLNGKTEAIGGLSGTGTLRNDSATAATLTLGGSNQDATFSGTLGAGTGAINLVKNGNATQTLSGTISYAGTTTINSGTLKLDESANRSYAGQVSGDGAILKSSAGTLTLSNASNAIGRLRIDGGAVTVTGSLTSNGSGAFAVADYGNGTLNISGGSVSISGSREFVVGLESTGSVNLSSGSLNISSGVTVGIGSHAGTIYGNSGTGTLAISSGTATILGTSSESIYLSRPRTDNNSTGNFSGTIALTGGTLETARTFQESTASTGGTKTSSITLNGGTLKALGNNANWIDSSIDTLTFGASGATIDTNGFDLTIAKGAGGSGGLTKNGSGTLTLTGPNLFTGTTRISSGKLELTGSGSIASSSNIVVGNGAVLDVDAVSGGVWTVSAGQTLKGHQGTVLASPSSGQGLSFAADPDGAGLATGGIHAPGEGTGLQTVDGNVNYQNGSIFEWEMNYNAGDEGTRGINFDALNVSGGITGSNAVFQIVLPGSTTFSDTFWNTSRSWASILTGIDGTTPISNWTGIFSLAYHNLSGPGGTKQSIAGPDPATRGSFTLTGHTLQWTAVPEPTGALAGLLVATGLLRRRRPACLT